ncbi:MAG: polyprenyl synthetase family protein [Gallionella sp.]
MVVDFQSWICAQHAQFERTLDGLLPGAEIVPQRLHQAMRYAVLDGGKRVRPLLTLAAGDVSGAGKEALFIAAAAVELIHAYSLVHDDLPCMDDDVLRRGKPTCHKQYDEATALLVGDSLQSLAFQLLAERKLTDDAARQLQMVNLLAVASGSRGMAGGQAIDLASVGKSLTVTELEFMHIHKTGALIRAAVLLGAYCGSECRAEQIEKLDHYGKLIGLAFQVVDDILDCESDTVTLGKTAGKDAEHDKPTYVSALGIQRARDMAKGLHQEALKTLEEFGDQARRLRELADFIVLRKF